MPRMTSSLTRAIVSGHGENSRCHVWKIKHSFGKPYSHYYHPSRIAPLLVPTPKSHFATHINVLLPASLSHISAAGIKRDSVRLVGIVARDLGGLSC